MTDSDWPAFCTFAERHFGNSHNHDRTFNEHWFKTERYDGWAAMILESDGGDLVGIMMAIVFPARFRDRATTMAWISTGVVEPETRARGGGAQLFMWIYRTFPLVGALSGNAFSNPMNEALGNAIPGVSIRRHVYLHDARAISLCEPGKRNAVARRWVEPPAWNADSVHVRRVESVPRDFAGLWQRFQSTVAITTDRSPAFLQWRYADAPFVQYRLMEIRRGDSLIALAVVRPQETPAGIVNRVVDFVSDPEAASVAWRALADQTGREGALFSDFFMIGSLQDRALEEGGFMPADDVTGLNAIPHLLSPVEHRQWSNTVHIGGRLTKEDDDWRSADALYFTKGDSDRDWPTPYDLRQ